MRGYARLHYRAACSVELGFASPQQDRHWLSRVDAYYLRDPRLFRFLGKALGAAYLSLRAAGRALRQRLRQPEANGGSQENTGAPDVFGNTRTPP